MQGRGCAALGQAIRENATLHFLVLTGNPLGNRGVMELREALRDREVVERKQMFDSVERRRPLMAKLGVLFDF